MAVVVGLAVLGMTATPEVAFAESVLARNAGCASPSEPESIPAALDAAIARPVDKDAPSEAAPPTKLFVLAKHDHSANNELVESHFSLQKAARPSLS